MPTRDVTAVDQSTIERGRKIYNFRCYFCHGYSGDANTLAATFLTPQPRSFIHVSTQQLSRTRMIQAVTEGRRGTAMMGFRNVLSRDEIAAVIDFVRTEFMDRKNANTRYHTEENGWADHEQYQPAFPFALNQLSLDTPWDTLSDRQRVGRQIFVAGCISCHDRGSRSDDRMIWEARPLSFPRNGFSFATSAPDTTSGATPYAVHDQAPRLAALTDVEREGERLFQQNCAFCHAADGTGRNWIGSFLESHPRNFRSARAAEMSDDQIAEVIRNGVAGTTMSAWRSVLTEPQIVAVVSYIRRAFIAPSVGSAFN